MLRTETATSPERQAQALAGLRRYQHATRPSEPYSHRIIAAQHGDAKLWRIPPDRRRSSDAPVRPPVVLVPSIINSHDILDLGRGHSFARFLAGRGHPVYLVDWGSPLAEATHLSINELITHRLLPMLTDLGEPPILLGYCLGGTIAIAAATLQPMRALVTLAAPWHFGRYPPQFRTDTSRIWEQGRKAIAQWGVMPMEVMQQGFWMLDRAATIAKFERFAGFAENSPAHQLFVLVEDWANGGEPLSGPAATEMFDTLFDHDASGRGLWEVSGEVVDPGRIACPVIHVSSTTDRIVPHTSAPDFGKGRDIALGHVGMIIGSRARQQLWQPLARWLARQGN